MAFQLYEPIKYLSKYYDKKSGLTPQVYQETLQNSTTLYVGNLSVQTKEDTVFDLFNKCGKVKMVQLGLSEKGYPAGFCFVIFETRKDAFFAYQCLQGTKLNGMIIRIDWDIGFSDKRKFGRGYEGYQIRDCLNIKKSSARPEITEKQVEQWVQEKQKQWKETTEQEKKIQTNYDYKNKNYYNNYNRQGQNYNKRFDQKHQPYNQPYQRYPNNYKKKEDFQQSKQQASEQVQQQPAKEVPPQEEIAIDEVKKQIKPNEEK